MLRNDDDSREMLPDEECPGAPDLESALVLETLSDVKTEPPLVVAADASLTEAIAMMQGEMRGCVLVVEFDRLVGIFTERDVLLRVAGHPIDLDRTTVGEYMTRDPVTLPADSSVAFALNQMLSEGFRHIPLVDEQGRPVAVVSMRELIEYLSDFFDRDLLTLPPGGRSNFRTREGA
jgi:2-oxoglutarate/2-oxoacid ferredoxin oxidoreductase subunit beta